jgi:hypothetical protein
VSGHQAPAEFLNPITFLVLALPYGLGALVCREFTVRWRKGWPSLVLLALGFGVYEEGLVARSIWDPTWAELGPIGAYSFWGGVTWTWTAALLHFHVTVSIGASVVLSHLIHPEHRRERWLTTPQLVVCGLGLGLWMPALVLLHPFMPPPWALAAATLIIAALAFLAWRIPRPRPQGHQPDPVRPIWFGVAGALNTTAVFVTVFALPESAISWMPPWPVSLGLVLVADVVAAWLILRWSGGGRTWNDRQQLGLVAGVLAFYVVFDIAQDLEGPFTGRAVVGVVAVVALLWLWRRIAEGVKSGFGTPESA